MNEPHTIWSFVRSSWRWLPMRQCADRATAVKVLRDDFGCDQFTKGEDGLPVWYIKPSSSNPPPLPSK